MKKTIVTLILLLFIYSCNDIETETVSYSDYTSNISYKVGHPRDKRLTFFDVNEYKQIRSIPNNLSSGDLKGRVQFAQTHTIDPNNNEERNEPSLIPYRATLLLFTPQENNITELKVKVTADDKTVTYNMNLPINMPKSDYNNRGSKPDITYSKRAWSVALPFNMVEPKMKLEFQAVTSDSNNLYGTLLGEHIEFAAPIEAVFLFIRLGLLTDNVSSGNHYMSTEPAHAMQEYFQTVPLAKVVNGFYEDRVLKKVILGNGTIYTNKSNYVGADYYSGDMREDVGKAQVSVGIDLANKGEASSPLTQKHQINHDMFYFTVHHAKGRYTDENGKAVDVQHGLSGGNGIGTLVDSRGNEFSHEVGHGYGMGHYPFINEASNGSKHGYTTSWGYDVYKNRMRANVAWNRTPEPEMFQDKWYIAPFQETYNWNNDCMAGGHVDSAISNYTHSTARSTRQVQKNIADRYFLSDKLNSKGEYYYIGWDKANNEYRPATEENFINTRINPTKKGVPVITILGGYDPQSPYNAVLYPYFRGNYGNVFGSLFLDDLPDNATCYLKITYDDNNIKYVVLHNERFKDYNKASYINVINKIHLNIAEEDRPKTIELYVNKTIKGSTTIDKQIYDNKLPKAVIIGRDNGYNDTLDNDTALLNTNLADKSIDNYTLSTKEKELVEILYRYGRINKLFSNQKAIAEDYIKNIQKINEVDTFIYNNYDELENNDTVADDELRELLQSQGLGKVEFKFNQMEINSKCVEVYESEDSNMSIKVATCNESKSQRWAMDTSGRIHSAIYPGYCIDYNNMSVLQICSDNANQRWQIRDSDTDNIFYESVANKDKCIDNSGREPNKIINYNCTGGNNQKFNSNIRLDDNLYFSLLDGNLIEEIWKYIPADSGDIN